LVRTLGKAVLIAGSSYAFAARPRADARRDKRRFAPVADEWRRR
jgi:hypothetical protein